MQYHTALKNMIRLENLSFLELTLFTKVAGLKINAKSGNTASLPPLFSFSFPVAFGHFVHSDFNSFFFPFPFT